MGHTTTQIISPGCEAFQPLSESLGEGPGARVPQGFISAMRSAQAPYFTTEPKLK
jgi:hypothetical protein